jgi:hypothetical protein
VTYAEYLNKKKPSVTWESGRPYVAETYGDVEHILKTLKALIFNPNDSSIPPEITIEYVIRHLHETACKLQTYI